MLLKNFKQIINIIIRLFYYYYCILRLSAKRYKKLLAIRLKKPLIDKNPRRLFFAPFLCSPLLIMIVNTIIYFTYYKKACLLA
jgi:hypothetical protein